MKKLTQKVLVVSTMAVMVFGSVACSRSMAIEKLTDALVSNIDMTMDNSNSKTNVPNLFSDNSGISVPQAEVSRPGNLQAESNISVMSSVCRTYYNGVMSGVITTSSKNQDGSAVTAAAVRGASKSDRESAAKKATVKDALKYKGLTDKRYMDLVKNIAYDKSGEFHYYEDTVVKGETKLKKTTKLGTIYAQSKPSSSSFNSSGVYATFKQYLSTGGGKWFEDSMNSALGSDGTVKVTMKDDNTVKIAITYNFTYDESQRQTFVTVVEAQEEEYINELNKLQMFVQSPIHMEMEHYDATGTLLYSHTYTSSQ